MTTPRKRELLPVVGILLAGGLSGTPGQPERLRPTSPPQGRRVEFRASTDSWLCAHVSVFFCPIWPKLGPAPTPTPTPPRGRS